MLEPIAQSTANVDGTQESHEANQLTPVKHTESSGTVYPMPEDSLGSMPKAYKYHQIDAGMVEVSLALAGLIFTAATITNTNVSQLDPVLSISLVALVFASHFIALWFLAAYCVQHGLIEGDMYKAWHNPLPVWHLLICVFKDRHAGIYSWLAYGIVSFVIVFVMIVIIV